MGRKKAKSDISLVRDIITVRLVKRGVVGIYSGDELLAEKRMTSGYDEERLNLIYYFWGVDLLTAN